MPADVKRPSPNATAANWKGQGGYAGAKPGNKQDAKDRIANAQPGYSKPAQARPGTRDVPRAKAPPKVQGSYAGATPDRVKPQTRDVSRPTPSHEGPAEAKQGCRRPWIRQAGGGQEARGAAAAR